MSTPTLALSDVAALDTPAAWRTAGAATALADAMDGALSYAALARLMQAYPQVERVAVTVFNEDEDPRDLYTEIRVQVGDQWLISWEAANAGINLDDTLSNVSVSFARAHDDGYDYNEPWDRADLAAAAAETMREVARARVALAAAVAGVAGLTVTEPTQGFVQDGLNPERAAATLMTITGDGQDAYLTVGGLRLLVDGDTLGGGERVVKVLDCPKEAWEALEGALQLWDVSPRDPQAWALDARGLEMVAYTMAHLAHPVWASAFPVGE